MSTTTTATLISNGSAFDHFKYYLGAYWDEVGDPRSRDYPLMRTFTPFALILAAYLLLVFLIVPLVMVRRPAYRLQSLLIAYNLLLSAGNAYFLYRFLYLHRWGADVFDFKAPSFEDGSTLAREQINLQYYYTLSKLVDLLETVFFVLRRKESQVKHLILFFNNYSKIFNYFYFYLVLFFYQITLLHTYHHATGTTLELYLKNTFVISHNCCTFFT